MRNIIPGLLLVGLIIVILVGMSGVFASGAAKSPPPEPGGRDLTAAAEAALPTAIHTAEEALPAAVSTPTVPPSPVPPTATPAPSLTAAPTQVPRPTATPTPDPAAWKKWPLIPPIPAEMRVLYERGLEQGTIDPNAFSVLGDCQSESDDFLGVYENNPKLVSTLPKDLQEVVANFAGSFKRYNPAAKSGSSAGSLLYAAWNDDKEKACLYGETPVDCELRVHRPSIVFIHTGTHYETQERNWYYLTIIIDKILARGAVPVLVTKADNLELDEHINQNMAKLAVKYGLPVWNFWSSVQDLPEQGLMPNRMHLTAAAHEVHRRGALEMLDAVWRAVR